MKRGSFDRFEEGGVWKIGETNVKTEKRKEELQYYGPEISY